MPAEATAEKVLANLETLMERGDLPPWAKPWRVVGSAQHTGAGNRPYNGTNVLLLEVAAIVNGYARRQWMTYKAIQKAGGHVMRGEKGTPVILYKTGTREERDPSSGETCSRTWRVMRHYTVFNVEQTEGLDLPPIAAAEELPAFDPIEAAEAITNGYHRRPKVLHGGSAACYIPPRDTVSMPDRETFASPAHYYATLWHEFGHSTGHADRLARKSVMSTARFGSESYGLEELVAETCSAVLMGTAGIEAPVIENAAAYCAHWLHVIRADRAAFIRQAGHGIKAAAYILGEPTEAPAPVAAIEEVAA